MNAIIENGYRVLNSVANSGEYLGQALKNADRDLMPQVTKLVYGVLDNYVKYDYFLDQLTNKRPQKKVVIVLKIGMYLIDGFDSVPDYAAVNECVELTDSIGKKELKGFVNATLKAYAANKPEMPRNKHERMSVTYSLPLWLVKAYVKQYGEEKAIELMNAKPDEAEHIRPNLRRLNYGELKRILADRGVEYRENEGLGFYVRNDRNIRDLFELGLITVQSYSSMQAVRALDIEKGADVLDICAAPGGKAVYLSELGAKKVTANELHAHRAELIRAYAKRMDADNIEITVSDATRLNGDWLGAFDYVLCDVPCSGLGVVAKKPDILINKTYQDILNLAEIQYRILNNAIEYLKPGGALVYSTCTMLREENYNVIGRTLKEREDIELSPINIFKGDTHVQILPIDGSDGFFIARLVKKA